MSPDYPPRGVNCRCTVVPIVDGIPAMAASLIGEIETYLQEIS